MDDIIVSREFDDSRNERIIVIYGKNGNDPDNMDIISSSDKSFSYYHSLYFNKYGEDKYLDDVNYKNALVSAKNTLNTGKLIFIHNYTYNDIVFTDTTPDECSSRYGILYLPLDKPSEEQFKKLGMVIEKIKDFGEILVFGIPQVDLIHKCVDNGFCFSVNGEDILRLEEIINAEYNKFNRVNVR